MGVSGVRYQSGVVEVSGGDIDGGCHKEEDNEGSGGVVRGPRPTAAERTEGDVHSMLRGAQRDNTRRCAAQGIRVQAARKRQGERREHGRRSEGSRGARDHQENGGRQLEVG